MQLCRLICWSCLVMSLWSQADCQIPAGRYLANWDGNVDYQLGVTSQSVTTELTIRYPSDDNGVERAPIIDWLIRFVPEGRTEELYSLGRSEIIHCEGMKLSLSRMQLEEDSQANLTWFQSAMTWRKSIELKGIKRAESVLLEMNYDPDTDKLISNGGAEHFILRNNGYGSFMSLGQRRGAFVIDRIHNSANCHDCCQLHRPFRYHCETGVP